MTDPTTIIGVDDAPNLAVDVQPDTIGGTFELDVDWLDDPALLGWAGGFDEGDWVNIVCDVTRVSYRRGATRHQGPLTRAEAGTATVEVLDTERRFDPLLNSDAIHAGTPFRVRAWGVDPEPWSAVLMTGTVDDVPVSYPRTGPPVVTLLADDLIADLAGWSSQGREEPGEGDGDTLLERCRRVLYEAGLGGDVTVEQTTVTTYGEATVTIPPIAAVPDPILTEQRNAAVAIRNRLTSGAAIFEDWSWTGAPVEVGKWNDYLRDRYRVRPLMRAAYAVLDRLEAGLPIFEDWTWHGNPWFVRQYNSAVGDMVSPTLTTDRPAAIAKLNAVVRRDAARSLEVFLAKTGAPFARPAGAPRVTTITTATSVTTEVITAMSAVSPDSDTTYAATLAPSVLGRGWDDIVAAADAELGRVWVDASGRLVVRGRESQLSGPVRGTLSDWHGEAPTGPHCCIAEPFAAALGTELMTNRVVAARRVPQTVAGEQAPDSAVVQLDDEQSQARYRRVRTIEATSLELDSDDQLEPWAGSLLTTSSRPELRVDTVSPAPWGAGPEAWRAVCETDLGDRWLLRYHPEQGPTVIRTVGILGVEVEVSPDGWQITWTTVEAPTPGANPTGWFTLDVSDLDSGDLLATFGGVAPALPA